jgi:itaconate CoA-transferase
MQDERFSSSPSRAKNRSALHKVIHQAFSKLTAEQVIAKLEKAGIANAKLNSMQEFWDHPQLAARGRWREVGTPGGTIQAMKPPFNLDQFEPRMDAVPALGAHSRAILSELGFTAAEIRKLAEEKIIQEEAKP